MNRKQCIPVFVLSLILIFLSASAAISAEPVKLTYSCFFPPLMFKAFWPNSGPEKLKNGPMAQSKSNTFPDRR